MASISSVLPIVFGVCALVRTVSIACLIFAFLTAAQAPSTAPQQNLSVSNICVKTIQFDRQLLVSFDGRPGNVTDADVRLFQRSLQQVYNNIAKCGTTNLTFRQITNADANRNNVVSYGFSSANTASSYIQQQFTWTVHVQGVCRGCSATNFKLFASDPPALASSSPPTIPPLSSNSPSCSSSCPAPRKRSVLQALNRRALLPKSISQVKGITLLLAQPECPSVSSRFVSYVAVRYTGGTNNTRSTTNSTLQNQLLAQSVLETYNDANALNTAGVCDNQFHTLTNIDIVETLTIGSNLSVLGQSSQKRRLSGSLSRLTFHRDFIFRIRGKCRGCPKKTALFNDAVSQRFRNLYETQNDEANDEANLGLIPVETTTTGCIKGYENDLESIQSYHRNLPVVDGVCYCQSTTTSHRIPTKGEFIQALNDRFEDIGPQGSGVVTIADTVQNIAQVVPINCSTQPANFTTSVWVGISGKNISRSELATLGAVFRDTYNSLTQQRYCDPVFRTINSVKVFLGRRYLQANSRQLKDKHRSIQQQVVVLRFVVTVRCLGCTNKTFLFKRGASRSRHATASAMSIDHSMDSSHDHSREHKPSRMLSQTTIPKLALCYCFANSSSFTAPSAIAFQVAFNQTVGNKLGMFWTVNSVSE